MLVWLPAGARLEGSRRLQDMHWRFSVLPLFECAENAPENRFVRGKEESVASGCKTLASKQAAAALAREIAAAAAPELVASAELATYVTAATSRSAARSQNRAKKRQPHLVSQPHAVAARSVPARYIALQQDAVRRRSRV